jgi:hypothetical protein
VDSSAVSCSKCRSEGVHIIDTEGNTAAARCDVVTMLLAAQGVVVKVKVKGKLHPRTGHEGPEEG